MTQHIVRAYESELKELTQKVAEMGGLAEKQIVDSVDALLRSDDSLARRVVAGDRAVDRYQTEIEEKGIRIIALRQPMAIDLREIISSIRISSDLERIADLAKNNAKRVMAIGAQISLTRTTSGFESMAELAMSRVKTVLDAYARRDVDAALEVWRLDGEIDALYNSLFRELLTYMMEDRAPSVPAHICCSAPKISSGLAITPPILQKPLSICAPDGLSRMSARSWRQPSFPSTRNKQSWLRASWWWRTRLHWSSCSVTIFRPKAMRSRW